jgi:uncharacterized membrane protein YdjX (TVP38/TMEM64 family)/glycosyltransferase involved in cell wall biosynthesis/SAM-dependent methyltransferase
MLAVNHRKTGRLAPAAPPGTDSQGFGKRHVVLACFVIAMIVSGLLLTHLLPASAFSHVEAFLLRLHGLGFPGIVLFGVFLVLIALSGFIPGSLIGVLSGTAYGLATGFPLAAISTLIGAALAFLLARSFLQPQLARLVSGRSRLQNFDAALARDGWRFVCLLRISPIMPFAATSYALGASSVSMRNYLIGTLASLPALLGYVVVGRLARLGLSAATQGADIVKWLFIAAGLAATIFLTLRIGRMAIQAGLVQIAEADEIAHSPGDYHGGGAEGESISHNERETHMEISMSGIASPRQYEQVAGATMGRASRPKLLVFIVAYNAERTINSVLSRIPSAIAEQYQVEVLVIDDASTDETFERVRAGLQELNLAFPLTLLFNPKNQGYGGNQKIGYLYAIKNAFDFVALVHGDGQYAPECIPDLVRPLAEGKADAVFGSRMMTPGAARAGGMPLYKFVGNKILTMMQNYLLGSSLSEFHSGYRIYSVKALEKVPFERNTNDFHFDTEIIIQFFMAGLRIEEEPIPTYYGDEICHVNGMKYAADVMRAVIKARLQKLGLLYDSRFDCVAGHEDNGQYADKLNFLSPHSIAAEMVAENATVADLGCAGGYMGTILKERKHCHVVGVDFFPLAEGVNLDAFYLQDLNQGLPKIRWQDFDFVLMLDVLEHLANPEAFLVGLRHQLSGNPNVKLLVSTGNIGFLVTRLMLLFGKFNYGTKGILDRTHTRLFTFATFRHLFEQNGYEVLETKGVPGPFSLALGDGWLSRTLTVVNTALIKLRRGVFSYQIYLVVRPLPTVEYLLAHAQEQSAIRVAA